MLTLEWVETGRNERVFLSFLQCFSSKHSETLTDEEMILNRPVCCYFY